MDKSDVNQFAAVLDGYDTKERTLYFKDYQLEVLESEHPLKDVLDNKYIDGSYILGSRRLEPNSPAASDSDRSHESISLAGSPLKLQEFTLSEHVSAETPGKVYRTMSVSEARYLLSLYSLSCQTRSTNIPPLWILCNGKDNQHTVAMATYISSSSSCNKFETFRVSMEGVVDDKVKIHHAFSTLKNSVQASTKKTLVQCSAQYDVLGVYTRNLTMYGQQISLDIRLYWDILTPPLQAPPLDATAIVHASLQAGDERNPAHFVYTELCTLMALAAGLTEGVVKWLDLDSPVPLIQRVKTFVEEQKLGDGEIRKLEKNADDKQEMSPLQSIQLVARRDLDFTELLWDILKECGDYGTLVECWQYIFLCLHKNELQPMVHKSNKSRVAQLVRDSYYNKMTMPNLSNLTPVELLIEIGTEKLTRDYINIFLGRDLLTGSHLQYFTKADILLVERVERLEKLQHALELVAMLEQYLGLPQLTLSQATRQALKHYESSPVDDGHDFAIQLPAKFTPVVLEKSMPSKWKADVSNETTGGEVHNVCMLTSKPPSYLHGQTTCLSTTSESNMMEQNHYYLTTVSRRSCNMDSV